MPTYFRTLFAFTQAKRNYPFGIDNMSCTKQWFSPSVANLEKIFFN